MIASQTTSPADQALVDAAARRLLSTVCAPVTFDREALAAAVAAFPVRGAGQDQLVGTWGRVAKVVRRADGRLVRSHDIEGGTGLGTREGRSFRVVLGPGLGACSSFDATRRERAWERDELALRRNADLRGAWMNADPDYVEPAPVRVISEWSAKSRARMVRGFASVDWSGLLRCYCGRPMADVAHTLVAAERCEISQALPMAMVTLTYPGDWLAVAPTGAAAKRHLASFRRRWFRALGWRLDGAWKLEFQRPRGWRCDDCRDYGISEGQEAPHFHLLIPVPATVGELPFWVKGRDASWLADTWADVVGAAGKCSDCGDVAADSEYARHQAAGTDVDFGRTSTMSDPKRLAIYFLKHGSKTLDAKEYQHNVPAAWQAPGAGPGRFWGFWGLRPATVVLDLDLGDWLTVRRTLRRVARARERGVKYSRAFAAARACGRSSAEAARLGVDSARGRKLRTLGIGGQLSGGWVVVNDGPSLAASLARAVNLRRLVEVDWGNGDF